ncbi:MAG: flippase-like domain-containing protein [Bacteroidota bacterium]|nr:flippase-like domain-containing protein [Bacteroidota bacterium]
MSPVAKKVGIVFLKAIISAISVWFIFRKVNARDDLEDLFHTFNHSIKDPVKMWGFIAVVMLMGVNWLLETVKWKLLLEYISPTNWIRCFRSVMSGVTVSILTPNRIGEFAGRVLHLEQGVRVKAAIASVIGSMNQLLITVLAGGLGLMASMALYVEDAFIERIFIILVITGMIVAVYIYFRIPGITRMAKQFSALRKLLLYMEVFEKYTTGTLMKLSILSAFRYIVFSIQFILMLNWFEILIPWQDSLKAISMMYLVMAIVPSVALSELTIRGSVALFFFSAYSGNNSGILAASSVVWIINLVIPALIGALAAFYFRFNK